jgi:hypothetical protein
MRYLDFYVNFREQLSDGRVQLISAHILFFSCRIPFM